MTRHHMGVRISGSNTLKLHFYRRLRRRRNLLLELKSSSGRPAGSRRSQIIGALAGSSQRTSIVDRRVRDQALLACEPFRRCRRRAGCREPNSSSPS
ncbi:hypothetical protein MANES_06G017250v8 [Manihot esculenta]|uniref:Uncharacterized protein n=1 Tax=Manihot esculenta TaxID=3983 RepID=A0ACB7HIF9_MANES|nr:hypothetical protein MANES_06G017250v8 [Manihot esculenta]